MTVMITDIYSFGCPAQSCWHFKSTSPASTCPSSLSISASSRGLRSSQHSGLHRLLPPCSDPSAKLSASCSPQAAWVHKEISGSRSRLPFAASISSPGLEQDQRELDLLTLGGKPGGVASPVMGKCDQERVYRLRSC